MTRLTNPSPHRGLRLPRTLVASVVASAMVATLVQASPPASATEIGHRMHVGGDTLTWDPVANADSYLLIDHYARTVLPLDGTNVTMPGGTPTDDYKLSVGAVVDGLLTDVRTVRAGVVEDSVGDVDIRRVESLLAATRIVSTADETQITLHPELAEYASSYSVYRDGDGLVGQFPAAATAVDTYVVAKEEAETQYAIVLDLIDPMMSSSFEPVWNLADSETCLDADESVCVPTPSTGLANDLVMETGANPDETLAQTPYGEVGFVVDVETPGQPVSIPNVESFFFGGESRASSTSDDAYLRYRTFILDKYIAYPGKYNHWFGGDNRNFSTSLDASYRTYNRLRMDWSGQNVYLSQYVAPTNHYVGSGSSKTFVDQKTASPNSYGRYLRENKSRFRMYMRHSVANPYNSAYPAIDYEWEFVTTSDGGISARGQHDGAPHHEMLWEKPYSSAQVSIYRFQNQGFHKLAPGMDVEASTCGGSCPAYGKSRWY